MVDVVRSAAPVGSRLVLAGAVLYLLEWVAILTADSGVLPAPPDSAPEETLALYAGEAGALGFMAGWFSLVLIGRVLVVIGIRSVLRASGHAHPLMDLAVAAMLLGVVLEVTAYGLAAAAAVAADGGAAVAVVALDAGSSVVNTLLYGPTGMALVITVWAMWRTRDFPVALHVLGLLAGLSAVAAALASAPSMRELQDTLSFGAFLMWIWMLWTGVLLWRRRSRHASGAAVGARLA
ncbi:hypothetical protein [Georgenia subflava]|uniref:DUF4386 family protein n=1 Tax=Georgenia subflava TaxID=1622177 RepID=A0A6N7EP76_9MICO|nr:hypothetical protein [Georgenia subflava]MPV37034.1 hypothetical protein [Georgenia subflava]